MTKRHSDQERSLADRQSANAVGLDLTVEAITNSTMQDIARSLIRQGCQGGLGNSRTLREAIRQIASRNLRGITAGQLELESGEAR